MWDLVDQFRENAWWFYSGRSSLRWSGIEDYRAVDLNIYGDAYRIMTPASWWRDRRKEQQRMPSGWGEDDAKGDWYANREFDFKNLQVAKGAKLPPAWQVPQNRKYLMEHYGKDCIVKKEGAAKRGAKAKAEFVVMAKGKK